ncbi:hypothetical protein [Pararhodobacter zhoushanensis]|uniref:Secreted protein n=1 Tax=Pararhodobacter zhoushanensis TaxID=2479545 RepID=A0ABT3H3V9_9RHOB|nr:hypothetical protein [Pararhodobacter zhoushanensis]MCW1934514.1 hypothetical protein [Pararhodobacter zhoushanensis]
MRFSDVFGFSIAFLASLPLPALASDCFVCDDVAELDSNSAACFLNFYDGLQAQLDMAQTPRVEVDLSDCVEGGAGSTSRGVDPFPIFLGGGDDTPATVRSLLRSRYIIERRNLGCLADYLRQYEAPIDPSITINLNEVCP